jgi:glycosyltransferase involved in cell wall biosynthesis
VHLVVGETMKDLVIPQVVGHMIQQAETPGPERPGRVLVVFLEPARVALRKTVRAWVRRIQRSSPSVCVVLIPYVSRLGIRANALAVGRIIRRLALYREVVFHCRGESAVMWAAELERYFSHAGVVADIRGAWPEEALARRGFSSPQTADLQGVRDFHLHLALVQRAMAQAREVFTVSPGMLDWLAGLGVNPARTHYVPCCVRRIKYTLEARERARLALDVGNDLLYAFLGSAESYEVIGDGLAPFFRATMEKFSDVRLLLLTGQPDRMRFLLQRDGIPSRRVIVLRVPHEEVWSYLCAADAGCILKQPGRLNSTWQPVKLGEYLASGLPVIVSRGVGKVDELVLRTGAGLVVDLFANDQTCASREATRVYHALKKDGQRMRECALQLCAEEFLWSRYIERVRSAYQRALQT